MLLTKPYSEAKAKLSDVMSTVVHDHQAVVIDRHRGKELMVLLERDLLLGMLDGFRFDPQVSFDGGEWVARLPEFGLVAGGEDFEAALDELLVLAEEYVGDYITRHDFFVHTDRRQHAPWVYRFALTAPGARRDLFTEPPTPALGKVHAFA